MTSEEKILEILEKHGRLLEKLDQKAERIEERLAKVEVTQENIVLPQLQALAKGQKTILETLAPKNRVEELEDEMIFMKSVIKVLSQKVDSLEKAQ